MIDLPEVRLPRVLDRVGALWHPQAAAHHLIFGQTGAGKTTLVKALLGLCPYSRVLILDPKPKADPVWDGGDAGQWGKLVTSVPPAFGSDREGGGPRGLWFRLAGTPDREQTARRFADALAIVAAEGHAVLVLDDVREMCRQLRLAEPIDSVMNLGRSANILAILCATETGWVAGRNQGAMTWIGHTAGLDAAKDGAKLLGRSGRDWYETTAAIEPHAWIYSDSQPGSAGLCITRG